MRSVHFVVAIVLVGLAPLYACGDTGDSKLSNGTDLPPGASADGGADSTVVMTSPADDSGTMTDNDSGTTTDKDSGTTDKDSGTTQKDSGATDSGATDSGHD